jgi:hypothetical protein
MSVKISTVARTVKILKPYTAEQRNGKNGTFLSKMVMFTIASDREYKQAITKADGTVEQGRKTDFFACRATGPVADLFNQYCSATKKDENGNDKLISRRLLIEGHLEKYQAERKEQVDVNGQVYEFALPEEREVIVVESIQFLDANPATKNTASAQPVATATAVQAVPVQAVAANGEVAPF